MIGGTLITESLRPGSTLDLTGMGTLTVFRYPRGDVDGWAAAEAVGRALGVPEPQLDWTG